MKKVSRIIVEYYGASCNCIRNIHNNAMEKKMLAKCGRNVILGRRCSFNWENVSLGNNIFIGKDANFLCTRAKISIGDNIMFGPRVSLITGSHRTDIIGKYMIEIQNSENFQIIIRIFA